MRVCALEQPQMLLAVAPAAPPASPVLSLSEPGWRRATRFSTIPPRVQL